MAQTAATTAPHAAGTTGALRAWATAAAARTVEVGRRLLRFAFYGRYSTEDRQNPATSYAWQHDQAEATVTGEGRITEEFFDEGQSRTRSWHLRPEAARLIEAIKDPNRNFDAIVIGSYERAFYGNQASLILPLLEKHGVALWMPEVGGPVTAGHDELVALLGILAKREIIRARARTMGAMTALVRDYGRYLGGRPAYGYRLIAAGPHPKRQHAQWGRKLLCLEPNPDTAPVVVWIFQMRLDGYTLARITRALNDAAIPCPSAADPARNRHRPGTAWQIPTVQAILANPVYTGHAVWKRTYAEHELVDEDNLALGFAQHVRRAAPDQWVISIPIAHDPLVSEEQFVAIQTVRSPRPDQVHTYQYTGLLLCGECTRRMEGTWNNGGPAYRFRHGHSSANSPTGRTPNAYIRESHLLARMPLLHARLTQGQVLTNAPKRQATTPPSPKRSSAFPLATNPSPEEVIAQLRRTAQSLTYHHPTKTLEVAGGNLPIRITV
jgi:DNA invertase Pin-like site-specific DNA recombinase